VHLQICESPSLSNLVNSRFYRVSVKGEVSVIQIKELTSVPSMLKPIVFHFLLVVCVAHVYAKAIFQLFFCIEMPLKEMSPVVVFISFLKVNVYPKVTVFSLQIESYNLGVAESQCVVIGNELLLVFIVFRTNKFRRSKKSSLYLGII
jgi:hypothetical protein